MSDFDDLDDSFEDDGFMDDEPFDDGLSDEDHFHEEPDEAPMTDISGGLDWEDIAYLSALSEELAEEKERQAQILREMEKDEDERDKELGLDDIP